MQKNKEFVNKILRAVDRGDVADQNIDWKFLECPEEMISCWNGIEEDTLDDELLHYDIEKSEGGEEYIVTECHTGGCSCAPGVLECLVKEVA